MKKDFNPTTKGIMIFVLVCAIVGTVGILGREVFPPEVFWPMVLGGYGLAILAFVFWIVILENA